MEIGRIRIPPFICVAGVFILGFIIGVTGIALWKDNWLMQENILNIEAVNELTNIYIDKRALFFLCIGKRLRAFFILLFMSYTVLYLWSVFAFFCFQGIAIGAILELLIIRYGLSGAGMYMTCVLPQGLFYVFGYCMVGCWCLISDRRQKKGMIIMAFAAILLGVALESFWNQKFFFLFFNA